MKSARLGKTTAFDVPCRKNLKRDTKEQTYNLKRDSENSNTEGASKKKKKRAGTNLEVGTYIYTESVGVIDNPNGLSLSFLPYICRNL